MEGCEVAFWFRNKQNYLLNLQRQQVGFQGSGNGVPCVAKTRDIGVLRGIATS